MVSWQWAVERLEVARNYWLATTKADGSPHAMPVWGLWLDGVVLFSTSPDSIKARNFGLCSHAESVERGWKLPRCRHARSSVS
ncbi:MAG: pyridoxamine 5'-phosphate oxidase family protein [Gaiellaceae bacterium]